MITYENIFGLSIFFMFKIVRNYSRYRFCPVFKSSLQYLDKKCLEDDLGSYLYGGLLRASLELSKEITRILDGKKQERVTFMCSNDANYLIAKWALWISGQIAVPLCSTHPTIALEYFLDDSDSTLLIASPEHGHRALEIANKTKTNIFIIDPNIRENAMNLDYEESNVGEDDNFYKNCNALIIYTPGLSGNPKGAVISHSALFNQARSLIDAWRLNDSDCLLSVGNDDIVSGFSAPLYAGARIVLMKHIDIADIWLQILGVRKRPDTRINMFISTPSIYNQLIKVYEKKLKKTERMVDHIRTICLNKIRLMSSGSGPVSKSVYEKWEDISGHQIQQRFAKPETGIILATPIHGTRSYGTSGLPFPGVHVRLISDKNESLIAEGGMNGTRVFSTTIHPPTGMLHVRGDGLFDGYWRKPSATQEVVTRDGDYAKYSKGVYTILGSKTDIVKIGRNVVSTLDIEAVLKDHPDVEEAGVFSVRNDSGKVKVVAAIKLADKSLTDPNNLISWMSDRMPKHAVPNDIRFVKNIPRNWQGEIDKGLIQRMFS